MMAQGFSSSVVLALVCLLAASASAFVVPASHISALAPRAAASAASTAAMRPSPRRSAALFMSEEEQEAAVEEPAAVDPAQDATTSVKSFFAPNENVRLGSSRDQDGKSNVWAIEPKMRVEGTDVESPESNKLVVVGGIIGVLVVAMSATIALLPAPDSI